MAKRRTKFQRDRVWLTPPAAGEQLGVNADRIRKWIADGSLTAVNVGDTRKPRWRIHQDEWNAFLSRRSNVVTNSEAPTRRRNQRDVPNYV